jgi:hypothetical protein
MEIAHAYFLSFFQNKESKAEYLIVMYYCEEVKRLLCSHFLLSFLILVRKD